jgi:hypothetical protein
VANTITVTSYTKVADPEWEGRLKEAKENLAKRTIPAYIEFCQEVQAFREHCDASQGGSEFSKKGCEWLGCSQQQLSFWAAVGRRGNELTSSTSKLPNSEHAIALIASLDDIAFPKALERLEHGMTQKDVKELIKDINPPRNKDSVDVEDEHRRTAKRIIKQFRELPEKFQFVVWDSISDNFKEYL